MYCHDHIVSNPSKITTYKGTPNGDSHSFTLEGIWEAPEKHKLEITCDQFKISKHGHSLKWYSMGDHHYHLFIHP